MCTSMRKNVLEKDLNKHAIEGGPKLTIIAPTYNERDNIGALLNSVSNVVKDIEYEVVVVDDNSPDLTWLVALQLSRGKGNLTVVRRINLRGLGTAILDGIRLSLGHYVAVMDADLQHPPERLPQLVKRALEEGADVVVASRYLKGGAVVRWSRLRLLMSVSATILAKLVVPSARMVSDPLSGFFLVRRLLVLNEINKMRPRSFKVLLEILERCKPEKVVEVPYDFRPRFHGKSKLNLKEIINFFIHLLELSGWRPLKFVLVGLGGTCVNLATLMALAHLHPILVGSYFIFGSALAIEASVLFNFLFHEVWTFRGRQCGHWLNRLSLFHASSSISIVAQLISAAAMFYGIDMSPLIAQLFGIIVGFPVNYVISEVFIWRDYFKRVRVQKSG